MFVKPREGMTVRRHDTMALLPPEGEHVPDADLFWHRRLMHGDVDLAEPPAPETEEEAEGQDVAAADAAAQPEAVPVSDGLLETTAEEVH